MLSQKGKDNLMINGDNNVVGKRAKFDGDYSRSDCAEQVYRFLPFWVDATLVAIFMTVWILTAWTVLSSIANNGLFSSSGMSAQTMMLLLFGFGGVLFLVRMALPRFKRFTIVFSPKDGTLMVGNRTIQFDDMQEVEWVEKENSKKLTMLPKDGSKIIVLHFDGARYVGTCIMRLWKS